MRRGKPSKLIELLLMILVALGVRGVASHADALGSIEGTTTANARVVVVCGKVTRSAMADASGRFAISGLPAGSCTVTASAGGKQAVSSSVTVAAGGAARVNLALPAASSPSTPVAPKAEPAPNAKPSPSPPAKYKVSESRRQVMSVGPMPARRMPLSMDQDPAHNTEAYDRIDDNPFQRVAQKPLSTFSVDVDTAAYSNARRFLTSGSLPPKDAVRVEEMINYFSYAYPAPAKGEPFSITTDLTQSPWNSKFKLLRIGLKAPAIDDSQAPPRNLVFLLDVSGSMSAPNKLPLLQQAMNLLVAQLRPQDKIAIVTYAGNAGLALPPTSGAEKDTIRNAIFRLEPGGSTNGAAGIQLAYDIAEKQKTKNGINRVILATDGDFNVGTTDEGSLTRLIEQERERGIALTVLGFGMGNYKDSTLEKLADKGNGNHAYIDSISEARKVLVTEAGATLITVAKDVKLQLEFNPATVAGYRLVGYENRMLKDEDFNDDKKDAGDIGAGHAVTALYEIVPAGLEVPGAVKTDALKYQTPAAPAAGANASEMLTVKIRYKAPDGNTSKLLSRVVDTKETAFAQTSTDVRWAVAIASFGMKLRGSAHLGNMSWKDIYAMAQGAAGKDPEGYRTEALKLIQLASTK
ncbi:MAG: von Willebrand factor type A domain-containing protein [Kofleriaceae bacterium]|nr:von Willebrand factor type A domain-containing protein [Kofleriaceae bacterium]